MEELVEEYIKTKKLLLDSFECSDDYFIKNVEDCKWSLSNIENWCILSYWDNKSDNKEIKIDIAVVKKNGKLQIFNTREYTMVIGIQCVKIAFIFDNTKRIF